MSIPLDVIKCHILPFVLAVEGLHAASRLLLVCKSVNTYAQQNMLFWMPFLLLNRARFIHERVNHDNLMRATREEVAFWHVSGWSPAKKHRVKNWESFRRQFATFFTQNYVLVPVYEKCLYVCGFWHTLSGRDFARGWTFGCSAIKANSYSKMFALRWLPQRHMGDIRLENGHIWRQKISCGSLVAESLSPV